MYAAAPSCPARSRVPTSGCLICVAPWESAPIPNCVWSLEGNTQPCSVTLSRAARLPATSLELLWPGTRSCLASWKILCKWRGPPCPNQISGEESWVNHTLESSSPSKALLSFYLFIYFHPLSLPLFPSLPTGTYANGLEHPASLEKWHCQHHPVVSNLHEILVLGISFSLLLSLFEHYLSHTYCEPGIGLLTGHLLCTKHCSSCWRKSREQASWNPYRGRAYIPAGDDRQEIINAI